GRDYRSDLGLFTTFVAVPLDGNPLWDLGACRLAAAGCEIRIRYKRCDSNFRRLETDLKRRAAPRGKIQLLKPNHFSGMVFHQNDLFTGFLADVFLLRITEPDRERITLSVEIDF